MTLSEVFTMLNGITGFDGKVAYDFFDSSNAPTLPFICFREVRQNNFIADSEVYHKNIEIDIELYSEHKDIASESALEETLRTNGIVWEKYEEYIQDEQMYEQIYTVEV